MLASSLIICVTENDVPTDRNTLVFKLSVACTRKAKEGTSTDPDVLYNNHTVTAGMLEWVPQGEQADLEVFQVCYTFWLLLFVLTSPSEETACADKP